MLLHHFGLFCDSMHSGTITSKDIAIINGRFHIKAKALPKGIQYAVYTNRERDRINTAVFEKHCIEIADVNGCVHDALMIFSDDIELQTGKKVYTSIQNRHFFGKIVEKVILNVQRWKDGWTQF